MTRQTTWVIYGLRLKGTKEVRYVGYAIKDYRNRFKDHLREAKDGKIGGRFHWIRKHGAENVESIILESSIVGDFEYLCYLERYWETCMRGMGNRMLNAKPCGIGFPPQKGEDNPMYGRTHTKESREKIRKTREDRGLDKRENSYWLGKTMPEEAKEKLRQGRLGVKASEETKAKMSVTRKGRKPTEEAKANMSKGLMGHVVSEETKQKISRARKLNPSPANHNRWHLSKGITKLECNFCVSLLEVDIL